MKHPSLKIEGATRLTRKEMKYIHGGSCNVSVSCGASITNCDGTCSSTATSVTCTGETATLTKKCKSLTSEYSAEMLNSISEA